MVKKYVKAADKLSAHIKCIEEIKAGNKEFTEAAKQTLESLMDSAKDMLLQNFNASIGSFGIGIAILANGNPIGCIFASILFGFLNVMGTTMGRLPGLSIPASIIDLIEGIVMVCVIVSYYVRSRAEFRAQKKRIRKAGG